VTVRGLTYVHRMAELCINIDRLDKSLRELIDFEPLVLTLFDPSCTNSYQAIELIHFRVCIFSGSSGA
jgi:hypothetical protein